MALRSENHEETICRAQNLFAEAQEELQAAHEAWEQAKQNHMKALRQKLDATREQMAELQHKLEQSVEDLRRAMSDWHDAHQGLALKLARTKRLAKPFSPRHGNPRRGFSRARPSTTSGLPPHRPSVTIHSRLIHEN